jgi:hypothetical protein
MFKKNFTIHSSKSKEEAIAVLAANVEPWRRDSSSIPFEGAIDTKGSFKFQLALQPDWYRQPSQWIYIIGAVEQEGAGSAINFKIVMLPNWALLIIMLLCLVGITTLLMFVEGSNYIPLIFFCLWCITILIGFYKDFRQVSSRIVMILQKLSL